MPRPLNIACLQTRPMPTMESALAEVLPMAEAAVLAGAQMLFLPEYCGGLNSDGVRLCPPSQAEHVHLVLSQLRSFAAERQVWVNIGSVAINGSDGKIINRGYMVDPKGDILGSYDKIHLFDVDLSEDAVYRESDTVAPGSRARIYDTALCKVGHTICYDLRFPGLFRDLAHAGAEILCCPAAFTKTTGQAHWHVLNRARAIENTAFVVSPCAVGPVPGGGASYGHSLVINPWGEILADGGDIPGVIHAQLDLDLVQATAARVPSLRHDRPYQLADSKEKDVA
ncbi:carbon-nitrogen hydrolase family protein [Ruegeria arenilitoris]|uniref:carbon-nitrogen hydrolase family protein n=1 Tax=Ruegeria arenilitoris TaxID=1173585 RepID=UPI0014813B9E|nr:carbon-nitrogen hydrolase family protein [Ruegeria arenilitoris]